MNRLSYGLKLPMLFIERKAAQSSTISLHCQRYAGERSRMGSVTIQDARFRDAGSGRLIVTLDGQVQITDEQLVTLSKQWKGRLPLR